MALVAAIGMLVVFAMLGTAYIGYMTLDYDQTRQEMRDVRAESLAEAGIYAAIGEAQAAIARNEAPKTEYTIALNAYRQEATGQGAYPQSIRVKVSDESARVNLNFAPGALLHNLGLPDNAVKAVADYRAAGKRLASVEALKSEGLIDTATLQALKRDQFTVYSGTDLRQPHSYINLNAVSEPILAAIFNINAEEATGLAAKRPFASWEDAVQKVGREPATFSVASAQYATRDMPADLALNSRCFRLESLVNVDMPGGRTASAGVEAVVSFLENGTYSIRYWHEIKSGAAKAASEANQ